MGREGGRKRGRREEGTSKRGGEKERDADIMDVMEE